MGLKLTVWGGRGAAANGGGFTGGGREYMEKELFFQILGIEETAEEGEIRKAYRNRLKETHPEDNPEGFKRLRQAYESALAYAGEQQKEIRRKGISGKNKGNETGGAEGINGIGGTDGTEGINGIKGTDGTEGINGAEETERIKGIDRTEKAERIKGTDGAEAEIEQWMAKADKLYHNLLDSPKTELWEELLAEPVCEWLDTSLELRERLLDFLMVHVHLPHSVWNCIDKVFRITKDEKVLGERYPKNFLKYIKIHVENENFLPYGLFRYRQPDKTEGNRDAYINDYLSIRQEIDNGGDAEHMLQKLEDLSAFHVYHPYEDAERIRLMVRQGRASECRHLAERLCLEYPDDLYIKNCVGDVLWNAGEKEQAYSLWKSVLEKVPDNYSARLGTARYLMEMQEYEAARDVVQKLLEITPYHEELTGWLHTANEAMIQKIRTQMDAGDTGISNEQKFKLGWCLFQNGYIEEAIEWMEGIRPAPEEAYAYYCLYAQLLYYGKRYERALPNLQKWLKCIEATADDGTEENRKRISRKCRVYLGLGSCHEELGNWGDAEYYIQKAVSAAENENEKTGYLQHYAGMLLRRKQYESAVEVCNGILEKDAGFYPAYLIRQEAYYELRKAQEVINDYHRAVEIYAGFPRPYLFAARIFLDYGQYGDAKSVLEQARTNQVEFTAGMQLCELKLLRALAKSGEERIEIRKRLEKLQEELEKDDLKSKTPENGISDLEDKSEVVYEQGLLWWDDGKTEEAMACFRRAIEQNPEQIQYRIVYAGFYYKRGMYYEEKGDLDAAAAEFEKVLEIHDSYGDACAKLADIYYGRYEREYRREDYENALHLMGRQIKLKVNCRYLMRRGKMYMDALDIEPAVQDFERALELEAENWEIWNDLGCCARYQGEFEKAIAYYKRALEYADEKKEMLLCGNMAACYMALERYETALGCYRKFMQNFPVPPTNAEQYHWEKIGDIYYCMKKYAQAFWAYSKTGLRNSFHENIGKVWLALGQDRLCIWQYRKSWKAEGADRQAECFSRLGQVYLKELAEYGKAVACFEKAERLNHMPADMFGYERRMARAYYMLGEYEKAKEHGKTALACFQQSGQGTIEEYLGYKPLAPERLAAMGWLMLCTGRVEDAREYFLAMENVSRCRRCIYRECYKGRMCMGYLFESSGRAEQAKEEFAKALQRNPHSRECRQALKRCR